MTEAPWSLIDNPKMLGQLSNPSPGGSNQGKRRTLTLPSNNGSAANSTRPDAPEVVIALMGGTGTGKSTFINLFSGSDLRVGTGLRSCTSTVQFANPHPLDGRRVLLIDTPGFDDTTRSDTDILATIANTFTELYEERRFLHGVLYFHRISDVRMGGASTRNFNMFKKLCGDHAFRNVVIVTNMWGDVDPEVGAAREDELKQDELFFKPVLDEGAQMARHSNTVTSAEGIIRRLLKNRPLPLQIQQELFDEGMEISQTSAGEELNRELNAQVQKHEEELRALQEELEQAAKDNDEDAKKEIEIEAKKIEQEVARFRNDAQRLASSHGRVGNKPRARLAQEDGQEQGPTIESPSSPTPRQGKVLQRRQPGEPGAPVNRAFKRVFTLLSSSMRGTAVK